MTATKTDYYLVSITEGNTPPGYSAIYFPRKFRYLVEAKVVVLQVLGCRECKKVSITYPDGTVREFTK